MALVHDLPNRLRTWCGSTWGSTPRALTAELARACDRSGAHHLEHRAGGRLGRPGHRHPCGLLLHELLTNCFARLSRGADGAVSASSSARRMSRPSCSGSGTPAAGSRRRWTHTTDSLGLQLVRLMTEQLRGTITLKRAEGTHVTVSSSRWRPHGPCCMPAPTAITVWRPAVLITPPPAA